MQPATFLPVLSLVLGALSSPAPAPVQDAATPTWTVKSGFSGVPPTALPTNCVNINLAGSTRNDLVSGTCKNLTLLFARGTTEQGNIGGIVGPPFVAALNKQLGAAQVAVQGVNMYPADIQGFLAGGSATGSQNLAQLIGQAMNQCPSTKLVVSGYSQGAQVAHNAAKIITAGQTDFINSVVLFGDPDLGQPFGNVPASKVATDCHLGDDICAGGNLILPPHLNYCLDVDIYAELVLQKSGLKAA